MKQPKALSRKEWRTILLNDPCAYCGQRSAEVDHIEPTKGRGADDPSNLTGSCRPCNRRKKSRSLLSLLLNEPNLGRNPEFKVRGIHYDHKAA